MKRRAFLALGAALAIALAGPAAAHKGHAGLTVVEIDPVSGGVTVVHRFYAHDIEPAFAAIAPDAQPSLDDPAAVRGLEEHLQARFRLDVDGARVALHHTDTVLAGDNVRIESAGQVTPAAVHAVRVDLDFFPDVYEDMEQQVNVRVAGVTRTVVFAPGSTAQTITFGE